MSDATVKFGAEDVGLEKTLKKLQEELGGLQDKVKSGDLSMSELESTMKRIGQIESLEKRLKGMGSEASQAAPKINELGDQAKTMGNKAEDAGERGRLSLGRIGVAAGLAGAAFAAGTKVMELAAAATREVVDKFGEALELGGTLSDLSARTGESAGNLLILQRAFDNTGVGADKVGTAVNKLQKFIVDASNGAATQTAVLARLGLSMTDLAGMTPTQQMQTFAERISRIENPTERAATAMKVFGKSGGELLPMLTNFSGEIANAKGELGSMPAIMDRSAAAFDNIGDKIAVVKGKVTEFAAGFLESALPAMNKFLNAGSQLDAAKFGQVIGQKLTEAFELITSGDIWQIFRLQAEKAINQIRTSGAINNLAAFLNTVFEGITSDKNFNWDKTFEKYKSAGIEANTEVNDAIDEQIEELWRQAQNRSAEAAKAFEDQMQEAAANSAIMLKDIPEVTPVSKEIPKWLERLPKATDNANKDIESIKSNLEGGADAMTKAAEKVKEALTMSQQIGEDIDQARKEDNIDKGGKEREKIQKAIDRGDFQEAERRNKKLGEKEQDIALRDKNGDGKDIDNRSIKDIAKDEGIDTFRKNNEQLRKEIMQKREIEKKKAAEKKAADEGKKRNDEMKPGNEGKDKPGKEQGKDSIASLASAVQAIANTVQAISKKLPQTALTA